MKSTTGLVEERVTLKHGAGGRAMRVLIEEVFLRDMPGVPAATGLIFRKPAIVLE